MIGWVLIAAAIAIGWQPRDRAVLLQVEGGPRSTEDVVPFVLAAGRRGRLPTASRGQDEPRAGLGAVGVSGARGSYRRRPGDAAWPASTAGGDAARRRLIDACAAAAGGLAVAAVLGGLVGIAVGIGAGFGLRRLVTRLEPGSVRRVRMARAAELPVALDLLAVCLRSGSPLVVALEIVGGALPGVLGADLVRVAGMQRLGASPSAAWSAHQDDPVLAPVVRLVRRSAASGSGLAAAFERLAVDRRAAAVAAGQARGHRAAVYATAPLGLCFLPAFALLTVVPLAASIATTVVR
jgi:Type II secretion system (T2SS), protein F